MEIWYVIYIFKYTFKYTFKYIDGDKETTRKKTLDALSALTGKKRTNQCMLYIYIIHSLKLDLKMNKFSFKL